MRNLFICLLICIYPSLLLSGIDKPGNPKYNNPNSFIQNNGQWAKEAKYLSRLNGLDTWIKDDGMVYISIRYILMGL